MTPTPADLSPSSSPLLPIPLPSAPSSSILEKAPCTHVLLTRVQSVSRGGVASAILWCFDCTRPCRVHKTSGAREAIDCVIKGGGMELSRRLSPSVNDPRNRPASASQKLLAGTSAACIERPESCESELIMESASILVGYQHDFV